MFCRYIVFVCKSKLKNSHTRQKLVVNKDCITTKEQRMSTLQASRLITEKTKTESSRSKALLKIAVRFWMLIAIIGLLLFTYYIIGFYGGAAIEGKFELWSEATLKGFVKDDIVGNVMFGLHVFMAAIISFGGIIQIIPQLRKRSLRLHRINGRVYLITAFLISFGGFYLVWVRESFINTWGSIAVTLNGLLIIYFGAKTWIAARAKNAKTHRRWALRTFIVASGVWFFRIGFMAWIVINQGPLGSTNNLDGPFDKVWAYGNYLLPLAILELYLYTSRKNNTAKNYLMAGLLLIFALIMAIGIFGAFNFMWKPYLVGTNDGFF